MESKFPPKSRPTVRQAAYSDFLGIKPSPKDTKTSISGRIGARVDEIAEGDVELFCPNCGEPVHITYTRRRFCDACHKPFFFYRGKLLSEKEAKRIRNPFTQEDVKKFNKKSQAREKQKNGWKMDRFRRMKPQLVCTQCGHPVDGTVKPEKYWICPGCAAISVFDLEKGEFLPKDEYEARRAG